MTEGDGATGQNELRGKLVLLQAPFVHPEEETQCVSGYLC